jgi:hypothetical protein
VRAIAVGCEPPWRHGASVERQTPIFISPGVRTSIDGWGISKSRLDYTRLQHRCSRSLFASANWPQHWCSEDMCRSSRALCLARTDFTSLSASGFESGAAPRYGWKAAASTSAEAVFCLKAINRPLSEPRSTSSSTLAYRLRLCAASGRSFAHRRSSETDRPRP